MPMQGRPRLSAFKNEAPRYEAVAPLDVSVFEARDVWPRSPRQAMKDREPPRYSWSWRPGAAFAHIYDTRAMGEREPCVVDVDDFAGAIAGARWSTGPRKSNPRTDVTRACPAYGRWLYSADLAWFPMRETRGPPGPAVIGHAKLDIDYLEIVGERLVALDPRLLTFHMKERRKWPHEGRMLLEVVRALRGRP